VPCDDAPAAMYTCASMNADETSLRDRIVDGAIALLEAEGLETLSMREVARRAGVSHQAPYRHFEDRAAILAAVAARGFIELEARLRAARAPRSAKRWLVDALVAYVQFALDRPALFRVMFRSELSDQERFPERASVARAAYAQLHEMAAATARAGAPAREIDALASYHWSVAHGLATLLIDTSHGRSLGTDVATRIRDVARRHADGVMARLDDARK
jgi:AcrR family transcriptional regulator